MQNENLTLPNLMAALLDVAVEGESLNNALGKVGSSEGELLGEWIAPQSSSSAVDYAKELMMKQIGSRQKDEGSCLYLVKKVLCPTEDYEGISQAISEEDTSKFKVLRLIGSNSEILGYKQKKSGFEVYLTYGKTPIEALRKTNDADPIFYISSTSFDATDAKEFDRLITKAVYEHQPEALEELLSTIGFIR